MAVEDTRSHPNRQVHRDRFKVPPYGGSGDAMVETYSARLSSEKVQGAMWSAFPSYMATAKKKEN